MIIEMRKLLYYMHAKLKYQEKCNFIFKAQRNIIIKFYFFKIKLLIRYTIKLKYKIKKNISHKFFGTKILYSIDRIEVTSSCYRYILHKHHSRIVQNGVKT